MRDAIRAANDDNPSGGCDSGNGADVIDLTQLTGLPDSIDLDAGEGVLLIDSDVTLMGPGADLLTVSGQNAIPVLRIEEGHTVEIHGLTLADGSGSFGGALEIRPDADVTLADCRITGPRVVSGSVGSPSTYLRVASTNPSTKGS